MMKYNLKCAILFIAAWVGIDLLFAIAWKFSQGTLF